MIRGYLVQGSDRKELGTEVCLIGRDLSCNIVLSDELLSRRHCIIIYCGDRYLLIDYKSSNGVLVNGNEVETFYLTPGDTVTLGSTTFTFDVEYLDEVKTVAGNSDSETVSGAPEGVSTSGVQRFEESLAQDTFHMLKNHSIDRNDSYNRLLILYKVSRLIASVSNLQELFNKVVDLALEVINADRGLVMLYDEKEQTLVAKASRARDKEQLESGVRNISHSIAKQTFEGGIPVLTENAFQDPRFQDAGSILIYNIRSALCCPLRIKGKNLGVIYVDNRLKSDCFGKSDLNLLEAFSDQVAIAIENMSLYNGLKDSLDQLKRQQGALIQNEKLAAMGQLSAGVAHEIRNPLTAISGYVQLYFAKNSEDEPFYKKMKVIEQALVQINKIVEGLLGFSRKSESTLEETSTEQIIEDTLIIAEHSLSRYASVKIERKFAPDLPLVNVDKRQIQQVFLNFMMNAAQAMPDGGTLTIMSRLVEDTRDATKKFVETIFRDTGVGIPKEKWEKLFQPFYTEGKKDGTGLGLSISKSIIEKHGGCIFLDSKIGAGTTFFIRLPAVQ